MLLSHEQLVMKVRFGSACHSFTSDDPGMLLSSCVICLHLPECFQTPSVLFTLTLQSRYATKKQKLLMLGCRQRRGYEVGERTGGTGAAGEG